MGGNGRVDNLAWWGLKDCENFCSRLLLLYTRTISPLLSFFYSVHICTSPACTVNDNPKMCLFRVIKQGKILYTSQDLFLMRSILPGFFSGCLSIYHTDACLIYWYYRLFSFMCLKFMHAVTLTLGFQSHECLLIPDIFSSTYINSAFFISKTRKKRSFL